MAWSNVSSQDKQLTRTNNGGRAFIVEALVLFVFLVATLIIVSLIFFASIRMSVEGQNLERATLVAANTAERFSADPTNPDLNSSEQDLTVSCDVKPQSIGNGILYHADITVFSDDEAIYNIQTSRFVSGVNQ